MLKTVALSARKRHAAQQPIRRPTQEQRSKSKASVAHAADDLRSSVAGRLHASLFLVNKFKQFFGVAEGRRLMINSPPIQRIRYDKRSHRSTRSRRKTC